MKNDWMEEARAQLGSDVDENIVRFAANWIETAAENQRNADFWRARYAEINQQCLNWPDALICPECGPGQDHPQPFQDVAGNWICGKCWFIDQIETIIEVSGSTRILAPRTEAITD